MERGDGARRGEEAIRWVFGGDAHLNGMPPELHLALADAQRQARGHPQLLAHEVESGTPFGDRMFHLEPGVHFQEIEPAVRPKQEFACPRVHVADGLGQLDRCSGQTLARLWIESR